MGTTGTQYHKPVTLNTLPQCEPARMLLKSERRSEAWAERREGVQLKGLELKKVNLEVIDLSEL